MLKIIRPLYDLAEAGTHWFHTYHNHHVEKLNMITSTFDPCLLIDNSRQQNSCSIVGLQTDDTIILANEEFAAKEEAELKKAKFHAKPRQRLSESQLFHSCQLETVVWVPIISVFVDVCLS
jgi:hypothetical protein